MGSACARFRRRTVPSCSVPLLAFSAWPLPAHRRVFASFFLYAFGFGGFFPRLGELQRSMGASVG